MASTISTIGSERWAHLPAAIREELDVFETELRRVQAGQMSEKVFLEFRLRHGVYGQRQDGVQMQRIKIPMGLLTTAQMIQLANLSEEYSDGVSHVTTRQDIQFHFVDIDDAPNLMRRLAEVGITTREACGNVVRNVTCCPQAGVCADEAFDSTPHARAMAYFLLRHPDAQNFGRKFKISFSGCEDHACALARIHDIGAIAVTKQIGGRDVEGFKVYLGGGLGSLPHQAKLYSEFVPAGEMLPLAQAIGRVFGRMGEKANRSKARMKFLIARLGIDEFIRLIDEERGKLPIDERWETELRQAEALMNEKPLKPPSELNLPENADPAMVRWLKTNVRPQRQQGYSMVEIFLPLGDIAADQFRGLANLARQFVDESVRTTVEQNILVRWVSNADLPAFYEGLKELRLAEAGAQRLMDITACPGTDSCKLGIASSRGLAADLHHKFGNGMQALGERSDLKIKISGCFNSCGQHHIADIGLFGSVQRKQNHTSPVFQVVLGGTMKNNAAAYGLAVGKVPSQNAAKAIEKLSSFYSAEKQGDETFGQVVERVGKARLKQELEELSVLPNYEDAPEFYKDVRQPWEYSKNVGVGECAGEMVEQAEFMLSDADRLNFEATLALEEGKTREAAHKAYQALTKAADGLLSAKGLLLSDKYDTVSEFRKFFYEDSRSVFWKPFAENYFRSSEENIDALNDEQCRLRVEEATLFIEQAQTVYSQM